MNVHFEAGIKTAKYNSTQLLSPWKQVTESLLLLWFCRDL